jgi:hypothetical protein
MHPQHGQQQPGHHGPEPGQFGPNLGHQAQVQKPQTGIDPEVTKQDGSKNPRLNRNQEYAEDQITGSDEDVSSSTEGVNDIEIENPKTGPGYAEGENHNQGAQKAPKKTDGQAENSNSDDSDSDGEEPGEYQQLGPADPS